MFACTKFQVPTTVKSSTIANVLSEAGSSINSMFNCGLVTALFKMDELECKKARVINYSVIDMKVNVVEELKVEIYNSGNIYYKGNPEIIIDTMSSSGKVLPLD